MKETKAVEFDICNLICGCDKPVAIPCELKMSFDYLGEKFEHEILNSGICQECDGIVTSTLSHDYENVLWVS